MGTLRQVGSMIRLFDRRITQSSALAKSVKWPHIVYTCNDDPGPIFAIDVNTGKTVGEFRIGPIDDTEALAIDPNGLLFVGAMGNKKLKDRDTAYYTLQEPGPGDHGLLPSHRVPVRYPDGKRDAEALAIHPANLNRYIASKENAGHLYRKTPDETRWTLLARYLPKNITDMVFSGSGHFVFLRQKGVRDITVLSWPNWTKVGTMSCDWVVQGESICLTHDKAGVYYGSEGANSPLLSRPIPAQWQ